MIIISASQILRISQKCLPWDSTQRQSDWTDSSTQIIFNISNLNTLLYSALMLTSLYFIFHVPVLDMCSTTSHHSTAFITISSNHFVVWLCSRHYYTFTKGTT